MRCIMACYKNSHYQMQQDREMNPESNCRMTQYESLSCTYAMHSASAQILSVSFSSLAVFWLSNILSLVVVGLVSLFLSPVRIIILA